MAEAAAAFDAQKAEARRKDTEQRAQTRRMTKASDDLEAGYRRIKDLLVWAHLNLGGHYQHAKGPWRKRRGKKA